MFDAVIITNSTALSNSFGKESVVYKLVANTNITFHDENNFKYFFKLTLDQLIVFWKILSGFKTVDNCVDKLSISEIG